MKNSSNIEEEISFKEEYFLLAKDLHQQILKNTSVPLHKIVIAVGGESGSGKSTTAFCLEKELLEHDLKCTVLHMDSYFRLPPEDNHQNRLTSLKNVGPHEINISLLNEHIGSFKGGIESIQIPIVSYENNNFKKQDLDLSDIEVLIVEGVYAFMLENVDQKIFLSRNYLDTYQNRKNRTREKYDPHVELILEIEHNIVAPMIKQANFVVDKEYHIL